MERLRDEGMLDWVYIEGRVLYKNNALDNVLKTRPELNARLKDPALLADSDKNAKMLDEMIARMKRDGPRAPALPRARGADHRRARGSGRASASASTCRCP